jgi:glycosyltransferase involved in cell wall biosynthesis
MPVRLLLLADIDSAHTQKWAIALAGRGIEVGIFSLRRSETRWFSNYEGITSFDEMGFDSDVFHGSSFSKIIYLKKIRPFRKIIQSFQPDLIHAHYATSYGILGRFSGFHPFILSAWGSDVMDFAQRGYLHQLFVRGNFRRADEILATSPTIEKYIHKIINQKVSIVPFGVDSKLFFKQRGVRRYDDETIVIGTIKSLEKVYRIDVVIHAFAELVKQLPAYKLHLLIVGDGTQRKLLEQQVLNLSIANHVTFTGRVDSSQTPYWHNQIDIFMNISAYESFGVSVLEAMACEVPVIVTDTGGLADLVDDGVHGFRVPLQPLIKTIEPMKELALNAALRAKMGEKGCKHVIENYDWNRNVDQIINIYTKFINKNKT